MDNRDIHNVNNNLTYNNLSVDRSEDRSVKIAAIPGSNWTVSSDGIVYNSRGTPARISTNQRSNRQRVYVTMSDGRQVWHYLNTLVLTAFRGEKPQRRSRPLHKDGNFENCRLDNLIWLEFLSERAQQDDLDRWMDNNLGKINGWSDY